MAEFPHLGSHCGVTVCNRLDFLPIRCDSCQGEYCTEHFVYEAHSCVNAHQKNIQVPVCPVCNQPIPTPKGTSVDYQVNEHIQNNCEKVKKRAIYQNRCSLQGCKKKELIPVTCPTCKLNYCLGHRHEKDHKCDEIMASRPKNSTNNYLSSAFAAISLKRQQQPPQQQTAGNCSSQARNHQVTNDEALARALQQEEYQGAQGGATSRRGNSTAKNSNCSVQ